MPAYDCRLRCLFLRREINDFDVRGMRWKLPSASIHLVRCSRRARHERDGVDEMLVRVHLLERRKAVSGVPESAEPQPATV